jgi:hypothetical protein
MVRRIIAFLGAGACIDIGGPTSLELMKLVKKKKQRYSTNPPPILKSISFIKEVATRLDNNSKDSKTNFEEIFHTLEMLSSYSSGLGLGTVRTHRPSISSFTAPIDKKWFNDVLLLTAKYDLLSVVGDRIYNYCKKFDPVNKHKWFSDFWNKALSTNKFDIATLNYDYCFDSLTNRANADDGFYALSNGLMNRFDLNKFFITGSNKILNLHGSIKYGYNNIDDRNNYRFDENSEDLYKYNEYSLAKGTWRSHSDVRIQSQESIVIGPILTGLRKTDKLLPLPYSAYYNYFFKSVIDNPSLLIIGYSFSDLYYNNILERFVGIHGNRSKIVLIVFMNNPEEWHMEPFVMDRISHGMYSFIVKSTRDSRPFKSMIYKNPFISERGNIRIYLEGTKSTLVSYGDEIIDFLTN